MIKKINITFLFFWFVSLFLSLIEAFTYSGFWLKHVEFNQTVAMCVAAFLGFVVLLLTIVYKKTPYKGYEKKALIFFIFFFSSFVILKITDRLIYSNFVFRYLHIQPGNLFWPAIISFFPIPIIWIPKIISKKVLNIKSIFLFTIMLLVIFNLYKTYKIEWWAFNFIITHPQATYDDKMRRAVGSVFYNYTQFIVKYTPQNSRILMPPQAFPWPQSGNGAFMRYFVYPRKLTVGNEYSPGENLNLKDFDYVLLDWGETPTTEGTYTHGWPKFDVPAENIIFMNKDGTFAGETKGDYHYKDYLSEEAWGLIKVKH